MNYDYDDVMREVIRAGYDIILTTEEAEEILEIYDACGDCPADFQRIVQNWCDEHWEEHERKEEEAEYYRLVVEPVIEKNFI